MNRGDEDRDYYRRVSDLLDELRPTLPTHGRPRGPSTGTLRRLALTAILALVTTAALTWVADYAIARVRLARNTALSTVDVARMVAIPQKSGKTEYDYVGADTVTCVRSLFPHFGYLPCWYANRNSVRF